MVYLVQGEGEEVVQELPGDRCGVRPIRLVDSPADGVTGDGDRTTRLLSTPPSSGGRPESPNQDPAVAMEGCALRGGRRVQDEGRIPTAPRTAPQSGPAQPGHAPAAGSWRLRRARHVLVGDLARMISHRPAPWAVRQLGESGGGGARCNFGSSVPWRSWTASAG